MEDGLTVSASRRGHESSKVRKFASRFPDGSNVEIVDLFSPRTEFFEARVVQVLCLDLGSMAGCFLGGLGGSLAPSSLALWLFSSPVL
jgi:hypothetical protein